MEQNKSPRCLFKEKMDGTHSLEEIKSAFYESIYSVCFNYDRGHSGAKHELFAAIWRVNPDAILTKADLCIVSKETIVWKEQLLLIDKNGTTETANTIAKYMDESGIISYEYRVVNEDGIKICFGSEDIIKKSPTVCFKGNLAIDGDKLILTASRINKSDK